MIRKRAFFLVSLPCALLALLGQAGGFYFIFLAIAEATGRWMVMLGFPLFFLAPLAQQSQPMAEPSGTLGNVAGILLLTGAVAALLSLASIIVSFRRHEPGWGWRIIPISLLVLYAGTWVALALDR